MDFWLYPGAYVNVSAPTKVTMTPAAPGEVPIHAALARAAEAQAAVADQAAAANEAVQSAIRVTPTDPPPPWEVTFTEKR